MSATVAPFDVAPLDVAPFDVAPPAPAEPRRTPGREQFLDAIRGIAVVRVVLWHTFAGVLLSWTVASMPTMFFVTGSLLAQSSGRRSYAALLRSRLRRLLVPFWVFATVMLCTLGVVHLADGTDRTAIAPRRLVGWLIPIVDPGGSTWEGGWVTAPLWYLRCYLWVLLLTPVLLAVYRHRRGLALWAAGLGVLLVDWVVRHPASVPSAAYGARWYVGDLITYSFFVMLGFAHRDGVFERIPDRAKAEWAAVALVAALLWVQIARPPSLVVNDSYPLLLAVGSAWLLAFLLAQRWIAGLTQRRFTAPILAWLGRRSLTVYLWHPVAIVAAYWARARWLPGSSRLTVLPAVALGVVVLSMLFGWVEDRAAGRPAQLWPGASGWSFPRPAMRWALVATTFAAGAAIGITTTAIMLPRGAAPAAASAETADDGGLALPPAPSAKPDTADFGDDGDEPVTTEPETNEPVTTEPVTNEPVTTEPVTNEPVTTELATPSGSVDESALLAAIDAWRSEHSVDGVVLTASVPGAGLTTLVSGAATDRRLDPAQPLPITSITKSMTSALILQLVDEGQIGLDDPLPQLDLLPDLPFEGAVTVRQLLQHTSGVPNYSDTAAYAAVADRASTPIEAIELAATEPLVWEPGTQQGYSSTGYLLLGVLAEQLTGRSYPDLLRDRFFEPLGMTSAAVDDTPRAGWTGSSAGGVVATSEDVARWGAALLADRSVLPAAALAEMTDVDNEFSTGLGVNPVCPCSTSETGERVYTSIGHHGGEATMQYSPADGIVIGALFTESMWTADLSQSDVADLLASVRATIAAG